jgi:hypothetical protein
MLKKHVLMGQRRHLEDMAHERQWRLERQREEEVERGRQW